MISGANGCRELGGIAENAPRVRLSMGKKNVRMSKEKIEDFGGQWVQELGEISENATRVRFSMGEQKIKDVQRENY